MSSMNVFEKLKSEGYIRIEGEAKWVKMVEAVALKIGMSPEMAYDYAGETLHGGYPKARTEKTLTEERARQA
jgi:hypothetical protein